MTEFIPYFAGIISLIFGTALSYALTDGWKFKKNKNK